MYIIVRETVQLQPDVTKSIVLALVAAGGPDNVTVISELKFNIS